MDGLTAGFAARELNELLRGGRVDKITQPERDTIVILIRTGGENRRLLLCASPNNARCHLTMGTYSNPLEPPAMCMLLRKQLTGARIESIRQIGGDRIIHVDLDAVNELGDHVLRRLVLEIMGRHSNLLLLDENSRILEAVRHVNPEMSRIRQIQPGMTYLPPPPQDRLSPEEITGENLFARLNALPEGSFAKALAETVTGLSRVAAEELACRVLEPGESWPENLQNACVRLADLFRRLPGMADARVLFGENGEAEDVFPFLYFSRRTDGQRPFPTLSEALEIYFGTRDTRDRLNQRSASMLRTLKGQLDRCQRKLAIQLEELSSAEKMEEYRRMGEAINANLYQLKKGMSEADLTDWSSPEGATITVPLDIRLTPIQNAQRYFKKYQKARSAREIAALEEIRQELVRTGYLKKITNRRQQRQLPQSKPCRYRSADGIEILVGKNATQNDRLTLSAKPEELWLHAKDMPGSHVIIRCEGEIPQTTLKQAALLAAWYSKGQRSSMVPVDYTLRKYVKKPSGAMPGKVIYTHQKTAYMTPEESEIRAIRLIDA